MRNLLNSKQIIFIWSVIYFYLIYLFIRIAFINFKFVFGERENNKKGKTKKVWWEGKLCLLFLGMEVAIVFYFIFSSYKLRLITFGSILLFIMIINAISRVFFKKTYIYIYKSFFVI